MIVYYFFVNEIYLLELLFDLEELLLVEELLLDFDELFLVEELLLLLVDELEEGLLELLLVVVVLLEVLFWVLGLVV
jgi:hypothetical protein